MPDSSQSTTETRAYSRGYQAGLAGRREGRRTLPWVIAAERAQEAVKRAIDQHGTSEELRAAHDALTALLVASSDEAP